MEDKVLEILNKDPIRNVNFINFIKSYTIEEFHIVGNSVIGIGESDQRWLYISSDSIKEFEKLIKHIQKEDKFFAVVEDWMIPYITRKEGIIWQMSCVRLFIPDDVILPTYKEEIKPIKPEEAAYIYDTYGYQEYTSIEYIAERLKNGIGLGIYKDDKLIAYVITHDDGAIGFLNVLKNHRRKGYAKALIIAMIKELRKNGDISFLHIEEDNVSSMSLALKIGFKKDRMISWFERV